MKIYKYSPLILFAILVLLTFQACTKEPESHPTNTELITSSPWLMVDYKVNNIRFYGILEDCEKDNLSIFNANGTYTVEEGTTKCDEMDPQMIDQGTFRFINGETEIEWRRRIYSIHELNKTNFKVSFYDARDFYELSFRH